MHTPANLLAKCNAERACERVDKRAGGEVASWLGGGRRGVHRFCCFTSVWSSCMMVREVWGAVSLVQGARCVQQDGTDDRGRACTWSHLLLRWQPCPGCGTGRPHAGALSISAQTQCFGDAEMQRVDLHALGWHAKRRGCESLVAQGLVHASACRAVTDVLSDERSNQG